MKTLSIDIETYSSEDITKVGVYRYVDSPDFEILLFAYAFDEEPVQIVDLAQEEELPLVVVDALTDKNILKTAFNAQFERVCISKYFNSKCDVGQWECSMVKAAMLGMPFGLDKVAKVLKLDNQKMKEGKALIKYFSKPCKPTKNNEGRTRNLPHHDIEKWELFKKYCIKDVEVEKEIRNKISFFEIPDKEKELYYLDQKINDTGIKLNTTLINNAIRMNNTYTDNIINELKNITDLENPNSVHQLKKWLEGQKVHMESLNKDCVKEILLDETIPGDVKTVLRNRQKLSKTSVKKYEAMNKSICSDGRVRGLLQFYGANRTGRWAGRLVQVQNLPKNKIKDLDLARDVVIDGDLELLEMLYGNVPNILSQLVRTAFIASEDSRFIVADFSSIEARVIAWLSGEKWRLDVFNTHGKIYEASASQMFHIPIEEITKGSDLRVKGKISELALGYQGGVGALKVMGALDMGIGEEDLQDIVDAWRNANKNIVALWRIVQRAAIKVIEEKTPVRVNKNTILYYKKGFLFIRLPSGRDLAYMRARTTTGSKFGNKLISYEGMNQISKQWQQIKSYGGKLTENIVQAIARDCLRDCLIRLNEAGYTTVMHVHDEVVIDAKNGKGSLEEVLEIMSKPIKWAKDLPLKGDGYETLYYLKD